MGHRDGIIDRVFNMSATDGGAYLFDDQGKVYRSWNAFRPVRQGNSIGAYRFS